METDDKKSSVSEKFPSLANLTEINSKRTIINHVLLGQQMTCEILTNLCCDANDNDSENWEDDSDEACSSDMVIFFNELMRAIA